MKPISLLKSFIILQIIFALVTLFTLVTLVLAFYHISDIHLDPFYSVGSPSNCLFDDYGLTCCRNTSIGIKPYTFASEWGDFNCDLNIYTLNNTLRHISQTDDEFLIITGDIVSHHDFDIFNNFESIVVFTNLVNHYIKTPILPVLGNHDAFIVDQEWSINSTYLHKIADLWRPWLSEEEYNSFRVYGYYTRFDFFNYDWIVLNSLWYDDNNLSPLNKSMSEMQYTWLNNTLFNYNQTKQTNILLHIPINPEYTRLKEIICMYSHKINYIYAGHTHHDHFKLVTCESGLINPIINKNNPNNKTIPILISPSVQTSYHLPSIRQYLSFTDYIQWHLPINATEYVKSYQFSEMYSYDTREIQLVRDKINSDNTTFQEYCKWYNPGGKTNCADKSSFICEIDITC